MKKISTSKQIKGLKISPYVYPGLEDSKLTSKEIILKAITYCYLEDKIQYQKVVGVFYPKQLKNALNNIKKGYGSDKEIIKDNYDKNCDNYFLEFDDESYFYTSNYKIGELHI